MILLFEHFHTNLLNKIVILSNLLYEKLSIEPHINTINNIIFNIVLRLIN